MVSLRGKSEQSKLHLILPCQQKSSLKQFCWISDPHQLGPKCQHHMKSCITGQSSWPGKPSQPIDLEKVRNFLISRRQAQCDQFYKAHGAWALSELPQGQEVLFRSPADDEYIPETILEKAPVPWSYIIEAQGKRYWRTREHVWPIHLNLPPSHQQCFSGPSPNFHRQQCFSGPSPPKSCIPRPSISISSLPRPSDLEKPPLPCQFS